MWFSDCLKWLILSWNDLFWNVMLVDKLFLSWLFMYFELIINELVDRLFCWIGFILYSFGLFYVSRPGFLPMIMIASQKWRAFGSTQDSFLSCLIQYLIFDIHFIRHVPFLYKRIVTSNSILTMIDSMKTPVLFSPDSWCPPNTWAGRVF